MATRVPAPSSLTSLHFGALPNDQTSSGTLEAVVALQGLSGPSLMNNIHGQHRDAARKRLRRSYLDEVQCPGSRGSKSAGREAEEEEEEEEEEEDGGRVWDGMSRRRGAEGGEGLRMRRRRGGGGGEAEEVMELGMKKRRLSAEQVRSLERSFAVERKLEAERKVELARQLRLHPRQVAVWFQNRRARWKAKQVEQDYYALKTSFSALQAHFDALLAQKQHLLIQVNALKAKAEEQDAVKKDESKAVLTNSEPEGTKLRAEEKIDAGKGHLQDYIASCIKRLDVPAAPSGTESSTVSETINSPHAIDSGSGTISVNGEGGGNCSTGVNSLISTPSGATRGQLQLAAAMKSAALTAGEDELQNAAGTADYLSLTEDHIQLVKLEPEESENHNYISKYCFIVEDQEGSFPWWSSTNWA